MLFSLAGLILGYIYLTSDRHLDKQLFGDEPVVGQTVHLQKTSSVRPASHDWRVEEPKRLKRLRVDDYIQPNKPKHNSPKQILTQQPLEHRPLEHRPLEHQPRQIEKPVEHIPQTLNQPVWTSPQSHRLNVLNSNSIQPRHDAQLASLPALGSFNNFEFTEQIEELAGASPIQPNSRDCGTLNHSLSGPSKHDRVKSVGLSRQLTDRATIGVEYVYKDGCYKNEISTVKSLNMPSDNGVNVRVKMHF